MRQTPSIALAAYLASSLAAAAASAPVALVICAPGYPSNTTEAQPSMDTLAGSVAQAAGWPADRVTASYYETERDGVARLRQPTPSLALVPLPFYLLHATELKLAARAFAAPKGGSVDETWTLVAKKGRVASAASLAGWEIVSLAAYDPKFIRKVALGAWGSLPKDVSFTASGQVLSALRRAAGGENVAVLLDSAQTASLSSLPFASDLEPVAVSRPVPAVVLCSVGPGVSEADATALVAGLLKMHETPAGAASLDTVRLARFVPQDAKALAAARKAYGQSGAVAAK